MNEETRRFTTGLGIGRLCMLIGQIDDILETIQSRPRGATAKAQEQLTIFKASLNRLDHPPEVVYTVLRVRRELTVSRKSTPDMKWSMGLLYAKGALEYLLHELEGEQAAEAERPPSAR